MLVNTLTLVAGIAAAAVVQDTDTTFAVGNASRLRVDNMGGEVFVRAWDRDEVRVVADHSRRTVVEIRRTGQAILVQTEGAFFSGVADFEVWVPPSFNVSVEGWQTSSTVEGTSGDVEVETLNGEVTVTGGRDVLVSVVSGDVTISGASGEVHAEGISGAMRISGVTGSVRAQAVSGAIRISDSGSRGGSVIANSTGGSVVLRGISASRAEAATVAGSIRFEGEIHADGEYFFGTHSGRILLELPVSANADLEIYTLSGRIDVDHSASLIESGARAGRRSKLRLGEGGTLIEVETYSGAIVVREAGRRQ